MLRRVRPVEACGGAMGFSPWGATLGPNSSCEKSDNDPVDQSNSPTSPFLLRLGLSSNLTHI